RLHADLRQVVRSDLRRVDGDVAGRVEDDRRLAGQAPVDRLGLGRVGPAEGVEVVRLEAGHPRNQGLVGALRARLAEQAHAGRPSKRRRAGRSMAQLIAWRALSVLNGALDVFSAQ